MLLVSRRLSCDFESAPEAAAALAGGRPPDPARPGVAEAKELHASLERAATLLHERERERDEQLHRAVTAQAHAEEANRTRTVSPDHAHDTTLSVSVPEDGVPIDGDPDRIVQVFVNLLTNAAKYRRTVACC